MNKPPHFFIATFLTVSLALPALAHALRQEGPGDSSSLGKKIRTGLEERKIADADKQIRRTLESLRRRANQQLDLRIRWDSEADYILRLNTFMQGLLDHPTPSLVAGEVRKLLREVDTHVLRWTRHDENFWSPRFSEFFGLERRSQVLPRADDWLAFQIMPYYKDPDLLKKRTDALALYSPRGAALAFGRLGPHLRAIFTETDSIDIQTAPVLLRGFFQRLKQLLNKVQRLRTEGHPNDVLERETMEYVGALFNGLMIPGKDPKFAQGYDFGEYVGYFEGWMSYLRTRGVRNPEAVLGQAAGLFPHFVPRLTPRLPRFLRFLQKKFAAPPTSKKGHPSVMKDLEEFNALQSPGKRVSLWDLTVGNPSAQSFIREHDDLERGYLSSGIRAKKSALNRNYLFLHERGRAALARAGLEEWSNEVSSVRKLVQDDIEYNGKVVIDARGLRFVSDPGDYNLLVRGRKSWWAHVHLDNDWRNGFLLRLAFRNQKISGVDRLLAEPSTRHMLKRRGDHRAYVDVDGLVSKSSLELLSTLANQFVLDNADLLERTMKNGQVPKEILLEPSHGSRLRGLYIQKAPDELRTMGIPISSAAGLEEHPYVTAFKNALRKQLNSRLEPLDYLWIHVGAPEHHWTLWNNQPVLHAHVKFWRESQPDQVVNGLWILPKIKDDRIVGPERTIFGELTFDDVFRSRFRHRLAVDLATVLPVDQYNRLFEKAEALFRDSRDELQRGIDLVGGPGVSAFAYSSFLYAVETPSWQGVYENFDEDKGLFTARHVWDGAPGKRKKIYPILLRRPDVEPWGSFSRRLPLFSSAQFPLKENPIELDAPLRPHDVVVSYSSHLPGYFEVQAVNGLHVRLRNLYTNQETDFRVEELANSSSQYIRPPAAGAEETLSYRFAVQRATVEGKEGAYLIVNDEPKYFQSLENEFFAVENRPAGEPGLEPMKDGFLADFLFALSRFTSEIMQRFPPPRISELTTSNRLVALDPQMDVTVRYADDEVLVTINGQEAYRINRNDSTDVRRASDGQAARGGELTYAFLPAAAALFLEDNMRPFFSKQEARILFQRLPSEIGPTAGLEERGQKLVRFAGEAVRTDSDGLVILDATLLRDPMWKTVVSDVQIGSASFGRLRNKLILWGIQPLAVQTRLHHARTRSELSWMLRRISQSRPRLKNVTFLGEPEEIPIIEPVVLEQNLRFIPMKESELAFLTGLGIPREQAQEFAAGLEQQGTLRSQL